MITSNLKIKLIALPFIIFSLLSGGKVSAVDIGQCHTVSGINNPQIDWAYPSGEMSWAKLEPTKGNYNFAIVDDIINSARSVGKKVWLQVLVADYPGRTETVPQWAINEGLTTNIGMPTQWDPRYLEYHKRILQALASRYEKPEYYDTVEAILIQGGGNFGEMNFPKKYCVGDPNIPAGEFADAMDPNNIYVKEMARVFLGSASRSNEIAKMEGNNYVFDNYYIQAVKNIIDAYGQSFNHYPLAIQLGSGLSCQTRVPKEIVDYGVSKYGNQFWLKFNGWGSFSGQNGNPEYESIFNSYPGQTINYENGFPAYWCAVEDGYPEGMCYDCCYWQTHEEAVIHNNNALANAQKVGASNVCFQSVFFTNPEKYPFDMASFASGMPASRETEASATPPFVSVPIPITFGSLEITYPVIPGAEAPQVFMQKIKDGLIDPSQALPLYVLYFYTLTIIISGILAFGSVIYGVILYLISTGIVSQMIAAREQIVNAIIGLLIILSSYVIMTTIDPKMLVSISRPSPGTSPAISYPGGYVVLLEYIEVPLGRLVESVVKKGWEAENTANGVKFAAEHLSSLTERLETITNPPNGTPGCRCSEQDSSCSGSSCGGSCKTEPCIDVRDELDCLLYKKVSCPASSIAPVNNLVRVSSTLASLNGNSVFPQTLLAPATSCTRFCNGEIEFWNLPATPIPGNTYTFHPRMCVRPTCDTCDGISHLMNWSVSDSTGARGYIPDTQGYQAQCGVGWLDFDFWGNSGYNSQPIVMNVGSSFTASVNWSKASSGKGDCCEDGGSASCKITLVRKDDGYAWNSTCGVPACSSSCGLIQDAIDALKAARCQASEAQVALAKELMKLKIAEGLLRDSQASPITYEVFTAFEGESAKIERLSIWDSVSIEKDPYDDPGDPYINEPEGNDPATFYVPVDGNEHIIELSRNAFFQFQPANGCGGVIDNGGGETPEGCTVAQINPFPAFYQYGPSGTVNPWQNSPIDSCSPVNNVMNYGCGPTSLAMIIKQLTGENVNPTLIASQLKSDGLEYICGSGSHITGLKRIARDYGLKYVQINANEVSGRLYKGQPVMTICSTFFGRPVGHVSVIKGDNCAQFGFQDTVWGERWEDKTVAQSTYGCNFFMAFCRASDGDNCGSVPVSGESMLVRCTESNPSSNQDLKTSLKYREPVNSAKSIISCSEVPPPLTPGQCFSDAVEGAPKLQQLFSPNRIPEVNNTYRIPDASNNWPVHVISVNTVSGESLRVPQSPAYPIGNGKSVVIAYADDDSITLKYTVDDNIVIGYAIQLENIAVEPGLLNLYRQQRNQCRVGGTGYLPALKAGDVFAKAKGSSINIIVRDTGSWMDPRWKEHWWRD